MPINLRQILLLLLAACIFSPCLNAQDKKSEEPESGDGSLAADQPVGASLEGVQAMGSFRKPDGWGVSLFAAEPALANPVSMFIDNRGRVFVCESFRQDRGVTDNRGHNKEWLLADLAANSVQDRIDYHKRLLGKDVAKYTAHDDRIRMLVDTDQDGVADRMTIFADKFNRLEEGTGAGVLVRGNDAYFTCIPRLWKLTDNDDDGVADERVALHDGFGVRVAFRGHDMHGLVMGPDGRLYFSIGDRGYNVDHPQGKLFDPESGAVFRCELDGSNLEVFATGLRNPQELAFDDYGYLFTGDNNSDSGDKARWVNVMEGGDTGWRMMYQYLTDRGPFNREKIWQPFSADTPAYIVPPVDNIGDGPSGLTCYPGTGLSGDYKNCFFMVDFRGGAANSGIRLIRVQPQGAFWKVERSEQPIWNILATDADFGPDGALWVCDWVNGWVGEGKGRVYRFFESAASESEVVKEVQTLLAAGFKQLPTERLGALLAHADRRIRLESQWELANRGDVAQFENILQRKGNLSSIDRLHAAWGLAHTGRLHAAQRLFAVEALGKALGDADTNVRAAAATGLADLGSDRWNTAIVGLLGDVEPRVQYAAAMAAGKLRITAALEPACRLLETAADTDPGLRHAGIMALAGQPDLASIVALSQHPSRSVRIAAVVALRKRAHRGIADFLRDADAGVQTEAARAIHDVVKLHEALPQLAALSTTRLSNDALAHRVLNANFRLGGVSGAEAIARFAANSENSDLMRREALDMLAAWGSPGLLDRVMNRYLPLADRDAEPAKTALQENFAGVLLGSSELQTKAVEVAAAVGMQGVSQILRNYASDVKNELALRRQAIASLVRLEKDAALPDVEKMLTDNSPAIRAHAIGLYATLVPQRALPTIEKTLASEATVERQAAWDALAKIDSPDATRLIAEGLTKYLAGNLTPDVWLNVIEAAEGRVNSELIDRLQQFEKQAAEVDPLANYRDCIIGGDPDAGKQLFFYRTELSCVRCHKVQATGGDVGPNLTEIGKLRDNRYLLESIVNPDAKIAENFETVVLLTEDDEIISGILRRESDKAIELMNADGKVISVDPELVVSRKKGKSSMPADLLKQLSRRELRDLVAYLSSLRGD
jgi:quinoprotein glucose dehydrogenase